MKREYGSDSPEGLDEIHIYDYIPWDRDVIVETIRTTGWKAPEHSPTTWRVDCLLVSLVDYLVRSEFGVSKIELGFSNMIRHGKMDRAEAIQKIERIRREVNHRELRRLLAEDISIPTSVVNEVLCF